MTEKGKFFRKLLGGTCHFFNFKKSPYLNMLINMANSAYDEVAPLKDKYGELDRVKYAHLKAQMSVVTALGMLPILGAIVCVCGVHDLAQLFKEAEKPKIEYADKADKNLEKCKIKFKEFDAQDLVLEHYFYPQTKAHEDPFVMKGNVLREKPFIVGMNQKVRE